MLDEAAIAARVATLGIPVLSLGIMDELVAPEGAQAELLAHAPRVQLTRSWIGEAQPTGRWRRHFSWAGAFGGGGCHRPMGRGERGDAGRSCGVRCRWT